MADIELRELRLFLALAEELHFGRTAERLGLTTSRASQTLRALERKLGGRRLFDRTSRVVTLTAAGLALHDELAPLVTGLDNTLTRARARAGGPGMIRLGVLNAASGTLVLNEAITLFEAAHEGAAVRLVATPLNDRLGPLRRREVDLSVTRLPLDQPDIVIGPLLSQDDPRVVMVAIDHPLAGRRDVSVEDFADYPVRKPAEYPSWRRPAVRATRPAAARSCPPTWKSTTSLSCYCSSPRDGWSTRPWPRSRSTSDTRASRSCRFGTYHPHRPRWRG